MTPDQDDLWFLPLGGTGEIGMNLNLYGHDGRWLMVDCGVTFPHTLDPGDELMTEADQAALVQALEVISSRLSALDRRVEEVHFEVDDLTRIEPPGYIEFQSLKECVNQLIFALNNSFGAPFFGC